MKQLYPALFFLLLAPAFARAQAISINTDGSSPAASAILDVKSMEKGVLVPRMTTAQRTAITAANALLVFDTDTRSFWFFDSTAAAWREIRASNIATLADADGNTKVQVEKNPNEDIIRFDLAGVERMALKKNASGTSRLELPNASDNSFVGTAAGAANTTGYGNTSVGTNSLAANTTGYGNTATGDLALSSNTSGDGNTASGVNALPFNTTGFGNTAQGFYALYSNTTGSNNTAIGSYANVTAGDLTNATAIGYAAQVGTSNSLVLGGIGADAVNVGIGTSTPTTAKLVINTIPGYNGIDLSTADAYAEMRVIRNTLNAVDQDLYLGFGSPAGSATHVYSDGIETLVAINQLVGIRRYPVTNAFEVEGDASKSSAGDWLANSDARLKKNISPLNSREMLEKLLALRGVTYEWNDDKTGSRRPEGIQYGFTAQNIQTVFPTLVEKDNLGYLQTAYGTYDAMTVEAVRALNDKITTLEAENAGLKAQLNVQAAQLQKISAALQTAGIGVEEK